MSGRSFKLVFIVAMAVLWLGAERANAQSPSFITQQVVNSAIQSVLQSVRDQLQTGQAVPPGAGQVMRFTGEEFPNEKYYDDLFGPLGYSGASMLTKAPPVPAAIPPQWGVWATGAGNWQRSTVGGVTTTSDTASGIAGADYTKIGIFTTSDAFVIGVDGNGTFSSSAGINTSSGGVGAFAAYINGGFSADFSFLSAFASSDSATAPNTDTYSYTGDLNYRFNLQNAWWIEPTVGATFANTFFSTPGSPTGEVVTVQGGGRIGTEFIAENGVKVQPVLLGLVYSNVVENNINGVIIGGLPLIGGDKGQLWGKGDLKFNFVFNQHFSAYIEGNVYGTSGNFSALGVGVLGGLRYVFN
jgi:hypothetical protein